jgi:DNA-binding NarL/FixJ family response regulator
MMLRRAIENVSDLQVVSEVTDLRSLVTVIEQTAPDWVVVSLDGNGRVPGMVDDLLALRPSLHILALSSDGSQTRVRWYAPHEQALGDVSLHDLIQVLREGLAAVDGQDDRYAITVSNVTWEKESGPQ